MEENINSVGLLIKTCYEYIIAFDLLENLLDWLGKNLSYDSSIIYVRVMLYSAVLLDQVLCQMVHNNH